MLLREGRGGGLGRKGGGLGESRRLGSSFFPQRLMGWESWRWYLLCRAGVSFESLKVGRNVNVGRWSNGYDQTFGSGSFQVQTSYLL